MHGGHPIPACREQYRGHNGDGESAPTHSTDLARDRPQRKSREKEEERIERERNRSPDQTSGQSRIRPAYRGRKSSATPTRSLELRNHPKSARAVMRTPNAATPRPLPPRIPPGPCALTYAHELLNARLTSPPIPTVPSAG